MKRNQLFIMGLMVIVFSSCSQAPETTTKLESTDSIAQMWVDVWNAQDVDGITAMFKADAIVLTDTAYYGINDLKAGFILPAAPMMRNLSCQKLNEAISEDMAYQSGSYKHEWVKGDSLVSQASGYYSMVWEKQEDQSWKLIAFHTN